MAVRHESRRGTYNQVVAKGTVTHLSVATIILIRLVRPYMVCE